MIFLIHYDRQSGRTLTFQDYLDSERERAQDERLRLEMQFNLGSASQEIILLEADSLEALRQTHAKYFN